MQKKGFKFEMNNRVYGIIGLGGLFLVGMVFGFILNGSDRPNPSMMTRRQCDELADKIISAARNNQPDLIAQLNKVFSENCNGRNFATDARPVQINPEVKNEKLPSSTCEAIEELLESGLNNENSLYAGDHEYNAKVYQNLALQGCEKNREKYENKARREKEIAKALQENHKIFTRDEDVSTCGQIEELLLDKLNSLQDMGYAPARVDRAQIYANLSERGCPENSEKYKNLAKQELDIARALTDDDITHNEREATEMVETYKRLQMQAEAAKMIEKAKKLTNPAIDFIIQLEKIIEE